MVAPRTAAGRNMRLGMIAGSPEVIFMSEEASF